MPAIHVLNGPNLNMLGRREAALYGTGTYDELCRMIEAEADKLGIEIRIRQSNHEGDLVTWIHEAATAGEPVILNAGAYTHTSIALCDALKLVQAPKVEVHISNVHAREEFRRHSYVSLSVDGVLAGFGFEGYLMALRFIAGRLQLKV